MPGPKLPLLSFELQPPVLVRHNSTSPRADDSPAEWPETTPKPKRWTAYIQTYFALFLILAPQYTIFKVIFQYHYLVLESVGWLVAHLAISHTLTFIALTSFLIVVVRDPGPVDGVKAQTLEDAAARRATAQEHTPEEEDDGEEISLTDALAPTVSDVPWRGNGEPRWCQKCWSPKPERCHHCSECGRCVLKMDHHCPWLASKCIGHRTYPAFVQLLLSLTLLCFHSFAISINPIRYYLSVSTTILETDWTPYHVILLAMLGFLFGLTIGSFYAYHVYLISTNQTTLEHLAPFLLLRHLPSARPLRPAPLPPPETSPRDRPEPESPYFFPSPPANRVSFSSSAESSPQTPQQKSRYQEHRLSSNQRRRVRYAHGKIRMYDLGFSRNWEEMCGGTGKRKKRGWKWWVNLVLCGGTPTGDGYTFEFNPKTRKQLARLALELENM